MKTRSGRHVEIEINMVDIVEPPEKRQPMIHHMPVIKGSVEQDDCDGRFSPVRPSHVSEQTPSAAGRKIRHSDHRSERDESHEQDTYRRDREIHPETAKLR